MREEASSTTLTGQWSYYFEGILLIIEIHRWYILSTVFSSERMEVEHNITLIYALSDLWISCRNFVKVRIWVVNLIWMPSILYRQICKGCGWFYVQCISIVDVPVSSVWEYFTSHMFMPWLAVLYKRLDGCALPFSLLTATLLYVLYNFGNSTDESIRLTSFLTDC